MLEFAPPIAASLLLMAAAGASTPAAPAPSTTIQLAQVTIEQRVIIRIPIVPPPGAPRIQRGAALNAPLPPGPPQGLDYKEVKGPKCLKVDRLRGAILNAETGITMVTDKDEAFRTHFGKTCRAADFYSGFYIEPNKDGSVCAGRDLLRARNGSTCDIQRFSKLVPDD